MLDSGIVWLDRDGCTQQLCSFLVHATLSIEVSEVYQGWDELGVETKGGAVFGFGFAGLLAPGLQKAKVKMRNRRSASIISALISSW